jgi:PPOX class probable F420-dependent enzyme
VWLMAGLDQLVNQQYVNLETFRKSGVGVRTPVWFVQEGSTLYVRTISNSGKVKRIRNNGKIKLAPCKGDGTVLGEWVAAAAREVTDAGTDRKIDRLLGKKYGLVKKMFDLMGLVQRRKNTVLEIRVGN